MAFGKDKAKDEEAMGSQSNPGDDGTDQDVKGGEGGEGAGDGITPSEGIGADKEKPKDKAKTEEKSKAPEKPAAPVKAAGKVEVDSCMVQITESVKIFHGGKYLQLKNGDKLKVSKELKNILLERKCAKHL